MTIEERLENVERELGCQKRRNRWLLGAILLVAGGLIAPKVFETTAIRARAQGVGTAKEVRAGLVVTKVGPGLSLWDEKGKPRAQLVASNDGPSLSLFDENGNERFRAGKAKTVTPDGKTIEYPESSLILSGPDGKVIWRAIK